MTVFESALRICNDLLSWWDKDKNEIDLLIENGDILHPVEIKTTSDPKRSMINAFRYLNHIPGKTIGEGAVICLAKELLPLTESVWIAPVNLI